MRPLQLLIAGKSASELEQIKSGLSGLPNARPTTLVIAEDGLSTLQSVSPAPDLIILCLDKSPERDLMQLANWVAHPRPALLLLGSLDEGEDQTRLLRLAMQAGARDFVNRPVSMENLADEINHIRREQQGEGKRTDHGIDSRGVSHRYNSIAAASPVYLHIAILMIGFSVKLKRSGESGCLIW